jgi:hypothetical protein
MELVRASESILSHRRGEIFKSALRFSIYDYINVCKDYTPQVITSLLPPVCVMLASA